MPPTVGGGGYGPTPALSKEEEESNILTKHFRTLNMQRGIEIKPQKGNFWPTLPSRLKSIWLKSSILAVSKSVLHLFVN